MQNVQSDVAKTEQNIKCENISIRVDMIVMVHDDLLTQ